MNNGIVYSMNSVIPIGYVGENETREIAIDIRPLIRAWPDLAPVLLAKRPGEKTLYPCVTRVENGVLYWRVTLSDTAIPGKGECVIHMIDGEGRVGKSRTMTTMIERSASGEEAQEPPEAIKPWIDNVLASIESVKEGYIEIDQGEENAGLVLAVGEDGRVTLRKGGAGGDGVGVESVEQTQESVESGGENVWTLRLTDGTTSRLIVRNGARGAQGERGERGEQGIQGERGPTGEDGAQGPAGADGPAGEPGKPGDPGPAGEPGKDGIDGVSPITSFERIDGGYRLTIKDAAGTHSVEIMDGVGVQGPAGPQGIQGPAGERGEQGERGAPFAIAKIYASQDAMNAGYATDGVPVGGFVLIETGDVSDEENARLYVKGESRYEYVTDLSGAPGIQGPEGKQGPQGPAGKPGAAGADGKDGTSVTIKSVSESSADGGSNVVTFSDGKTVTIKNGKTGAQGPMGPTGEIGPAGPTGPAGADGKDGAQGPAGPAGPAGSDATVTAANIQAALGYKPASEAAVSQLSEKIGKLEDEGYVTYTNLFDKTKLRTGGLYTGDRWTDGSYIASAPIYLTAGDYLITNRYNVYSSNAMRAYKVYEDGEPAGYASEVGVALSDDVVCVTIPEDSFWAFNICKSTSTSATVDNYMLVAGSTLNDWPPEYVPYGEPLKVEIDPNVTYSENPLYKKTVVFDGDSICAGVGWAGRIANKNKMTYSNQAAGGGTITSGTLNGENNRHWVSTNLDAIHAAYPNLDYLILEGGTNDADVLGLDGLGTMSVSKVQPADFDPTADFTQAMEYMCSKAITLFPTAQIGFIVAQKMGTVNDYSASTRRKFFDRCVEVCKKYGIPCLDLWNTCHLHPKIDHASHGDAYYMYTDGQHLSDAGYDYITPIIEAWMKAMYSQQSSSGGASVDQEAIVQQVIAALPVYTGEVV